MSEMQESCLPLAAGSLNMPLHNPFPVRSMSPRPPGNTSKNQAAAPAPEMKMGLMTLLLLAMFVVLSLPAGMVDCSLNTTINFKCVFLLYLACSGPNEPGLFVADSTTDRVGPNYFQDTCSATISPGTQCQPRKCSDDCTSRFRGGVGDCDHSVCRCVYTCPATPPAAKKKQPYV